MPKYEFVAGLCMFQGITDTQEVKIMSDEALFRKMDEDERIYAPQQLPHDDQAHVEAADRIPLIAAGDIGATAGGVPVQTPPGGVVLPGNPIVETHTDMPHGGVTDDLDERDEDR